jgi:dTDP-4-dehydrorhamnose reductase
LSGKKIVITGANGQLGQTLMRASMFGEHTLIPLTRQQLDISSQASVDSVLDSLVPDIIINAAAYTAVDAAESNRDAAYAINEDGPGNLANWVNNSAAKLIHVSTDFVFDGQGHRPYKTQDKTRPVSVYGSSKLAGERKVLDILGQKASIVRTAWLYSPFNSNFVKTMLRLMGERDSLSVIDDQVGTPCSSFSLARCLAAIIESDSCGGVYHWTDAGVASWYDFAVAIQNEALTLGLLEQAIAITPITTEQYPTPARRPAYSVLDKHETLQQISVTQRHWREELKDVLIALSGREQG